MHRKCWCRVLKSEQIMNTTSVAGININHSPPAFTGQLNRYLLKGFLRTAIRNEHKTAIKKLRSPGDMKLS